MLADSLNSAIMDANPTMQVSASSNSIADIIIPICFFSAALAVHFRIMSLRLKSLQNLADRYHLMRISNDLPGDFPTDMMDGIGSFNRVSNAFWGSHDADLLLVFDIQIGLGRQSYTRTIVGRRFLSLPAEPKLKSSLSYQQVGQWRVAYAR
ncbi:hypothetical protein [Granulicella tundricola]|uniref:Uncharacterized protein n=1 Tax=Granulicella tundricola (strain ATCC BAA-1859 / DSM 23138 / MP5ACTX9) TaxID=1198114 RepID=E8X234_GRATM|nr:hypothetical protein [Granulicella tundricola]ADW70277.1 hypothetical protein AciX9_3266 [Granulicella tundricola MP5ACTX9]